MIDKIFICHWDKLTDRKEKLIKVLSEENIFDYEFVCDYDKDTWSEEEIKYDFPKIFEVVEGYGRKLKSSEISLSLKHIKIIREVAEKYEYALVLEDTKNFAAGDTIRPGNAPRVGNYIMGGDYETKKKGKKNYKITGDAK